MFCLDLISFINKQIKKLYPNITNEQERKFVSGWKRIRHPNITKEEFLLEEARRKARIIVFKWGVIIKVDENNNPTGEVF